MALLSCSGHSLPHLLGASDLETARTLHLEPAALAALSLGGWSSEGPRLPNPPSLTPQAAAVIHLPTWGQECGTRVKSPLLLHQAIPNPTLSPLEGAEGAAENTGRGVCFIFLK